MAAKVPPQPERLGRYELITRLAAGGMAEIYLARETGLAGFERLVVIKRILPHRAGDPDFVAMFQREARIVAQIAHPNVVHIHELGEVDGVYYIAMEYIHGCTLREVQLLAQREAVVVPPSVVIAMIAEACRGAHAGHELTDANGRNIGLVHRDISPHNIMVTAQGHVKLIDFGIAKGQHREGFETTKGESIRGKYGYMSPEQCLRRPLDRRSDVFSLGIILWELAAGRPLFKRDSELEMMKAITESEAPPIQFVSPAVPEALDAIAMRALEKDPDRRFGSAEVMRLELLQAARELTLEASKDQIGEFVRRVAGERLAERDEVVETAKERALTPGERSFLVHELESMVVSVVSGLVPVDRLEAPSRAEDLAELHPAERAVTRRTGRNLVLALLALGLLGGIGYVVATHRTGDSPPAVAGEAEALAETTEAPVPLSGAPISVGWAPTVDAELLRSELEPLRRHLEQRLQRPIQFVLASSYGDLAERVLQGEFQFGVFPPLLYVRTRLRAAHLLDLIAIKEFEGATQSDGYLLVVQNAPFATVAELQGKRFCFTDEDSTTGNFLPRALLRSQGHDPETFIGEVHWSGDHLQVLRDLLDDKCDAAATYSGSLLTASALGVPSGQLRVLSVTGHIPQDVVVAGPAAPAEARAKLRDALLTFDPLQALGRPFVGNSQRISGFGEAREAMFESLRAVVAEQAAITAPAPVPEEPRRRRRR